MRTLLKTHFGFDKFRPLQEEIINNIIAQKDTFVLMPTGGGKSLCYQLPALQFDGMTLVVSPLIALMKDQVDTLKANGISAEFINSSLTYQEIDQIQRNVLAGRVKILYVAPERLALDKFLHFLDRVNISLNAIDEAHCISEWGHDFRPDYRNLKLFRKRFSQIPIIALTATATSRVQEDIIQQLALDNPRKFISSFDRANLTLIVYKKRKAYDKLLYLIKKHRTESVIVYCFSRKDTEKIAKNLTSDGFKALPYHAGLDSQTRKKHQELFIKDEVNIIAATIAFGMGIDKPDIRLIVHYTFPKTLEGYYQEIGRAGRDGLPGECVLLYSYGDKRKHEYFLNEISDPQERARTQQKINQVVEYCEHSGCRRKYILKYFGENYQNSTQQGCGNCDLCLSEQETFDATEITQKIMSAILRTNNCFGRRYIIDVLKGKLSQKILNNRHNELSTFNIVQDYTINDLDDIMQTLVSVGLLSMSSEEYPTILLTKKGVQWLKQRDKLELPKMRDDLTIASIQQDQLDFDAELLEKLRCLRKNIADDLEVPPFVIFSDVSLQQMAYYMPCDRDNFLCINGVGTKKLNRFGNIFLDSISKYVEAKGLSSKTIPPAGNSNTPKTKKSQVRSSCYQRTKQMLEQKMPISDIADQQGIKKNTVIDHTFHLLTAGEILDLSHLQMLPPEDLKKIQAAFTECGLEKLRPVYEYLQEQYSYDDIKLVRLVEMAK